ncbi:phospholipase-like protein [Tanacetum coccineum]
MTLKDAKAQMEEIKRIEFLKAEKEKSEKRADPLPITKICYRINNSIKEASMIITRDNQPLNLTVYDKFVQRMLGFSEWVKVHALASKVRSTSRSVTQKSKVERKVGMKRKRRSELIHETFIKENIVVDGMQRNLTLLEGVVGKAGMDFFELVVITLEKLSSASRGCYPEMTRVFDLLSGGKFSVPVYDLQLHGLIVRLFTQFLTAADFSSTAVVPMMKKTMTVIIKESKPLNSELVKLLVRRIPSSRRIGGNVLKNCAAQLKPYLPDRVRDICLSL